MSNLERTEQIPVINEKKPNRNKKKRRNYTRWYMILTIVTIIVNLAFIAEMFYVTQYAALSKDVFIKINLIALVVLLVIDILVFVSIRVKQFVLLIITTCLLVASTGVGGYAGYALLRVNKSVNDITNIEYTKSVNTSLVVYSKSSGKPVVDLSDLDGTTVGYATGTDTAEVGQEYLKKNGINPEYKQYNDYISVITALLGSEIDVAIVPSTYTNIVEDDESLAVYSEDLSAIDTFSASVQATGVSGADKDLTKEPFTVLLSGENEGLADTIILVTVNPVSMKVTMTSIARDSYVPITCYGGGSSKINAAHAVSEGCLVDTVEQTTGVKIDYTVEFNFDSVIEVVDAVGGIEVDNDVLFPAITWDIEKQEQFSRWMPVGKNVHLDGRLALGYARERYAFEDGDFARQRHQQEIIEKVLQKIMDTRDPNTYLKVLKAAGDNIKTNFTTDQLVNFVSYAMKKAARYYDSGNLANVFNIQTSTISGYSVMMWDDGLDMYLWTYWLYDGAIKDTYDAVERNITLTTTPSAVGSVSWNAHDTYTAPPISDDYYPESGETTIGGPDDSSYYQQTEVQEPQQEQQPAEIPDNSTTVDPTPVEPDHNAGNTDYSGSDTPSDDSTDSSTESNQ